MILNQIFEPVAVARVTCNIYQQTNVAVAVARCSNCDIYQQNLKILKSLNTQEISSA